MRDSHFDVASRVATGCHSSTPIEHIHWEMRELPLAEHVELRGAQYLASAMRTSYPSHDIATADPGPRLMKHTLMTKYRDIVGPFLEGGGGDAAEQIQEGHRRHPYQRSRQDC